MHSERRTTKRKPRTVGNLCIITARGGSKRIPRKNIREFLGKPIISYSIEAALSSDLFDEVMVSTDDLEISEVAKEYGAVVPFMRSRENADDYATTLDVVKEVLDAFLDRGVSFKNVCILYPTAPFVTASRLKEGFSHLEVSNAAIPVAEFSFPIWRAFRITDDTLSYQWPEYERSRSQDLEKLYHDVGQWYWIRTDCVLDTLVPENTAPVIIHPMEAQDIDTIEDWELAELKYQKLHPKAKT